MGFRTKFANLSRMRSKAFEKRLKYLNEPVADDFNGLHRLEEKHAQSSCRWEDAPEDGVNYNLCSTGTCRGERGSYSNNGSVRFTKCNKHLFLAEGYEKDSCENGVWSSSGHKCVRK